MRRKTKRGGSQLPITLKSIAPIVGDSKYRDARKVVSYYGEKIQSDKRKRGLLEKELEKVRKEEELDRNMKSKGERSLLEVLSANQMLSIMHNLVLMSDVKALLSDTSKEHTLIFPTNDNLKQSNLNIEKLMENRDALNEFLGDYILHGNVHSKKLKPEVPVVVRNLNRKELEIVKTPANKVIIKHEKKPVAVVVHGNLTHNDDTLPKHGNVHSITDLATITPEKMVDAAKDTAKKITENTKELVTNAKDAVSGAEEGVAKARDTVAGIAGNAVKTITNFFTGASGKAKEAVKSAEATASSAVKSVTAGGGKKKRKTKRKRHNKKTKRKRHSKKHTKKRRRRN